MDHVEETGYKPMWQPFVDESLKVAQKLDALTESLRKIVPCVGAGALIAVGTALYLIYLTSRETRRAAQASLLSQLHAEYASPEMTAAIRDLYRWAQSANCGPTSVLMVASAPAYNNAKPMASQINQMDDWLYAQYGASYGNPAANNYLGYGTTTTELAALAAGPLFGLTQSVAFSGWTMSQLTAGTRQRVPRNRLRVCTDEGSISRRSLYGATGNGQPKRLRE